MAAASPPPKACLGSSCAVAPRYQSIRECKLHPHCHALLLSRDHRPSPSATCCCGPAAACLFVAASACAVTVPRSPPSILTAASTLADHDLRAGEKIHIMSRLISGSTTPHGLRQAFRRHTSDQPLRWTPEAVRIVARCTIAGKNMICRRTVSASRRETNRHPPEHIDDFIHGTEVSVAGKRNFQGRDKEAETALEIQGPRCRDKISPNNPPIRGYSTRTGKPPLERECVVGLRGTRTGCQARSRYRTGLSRVIPPRRFCDQMSLSANIIQKVLACGRHWSGTVS